MPTGTGFAVSSHTLLTSAHVINGQIDELTASRRNFSLLHEAAHKALEYEEGRWLLVFDNADTPEDFLDYCQGTQLTDAAAADPPLVSQSLRSWIARSQPEGRLASWNTPRSAGLPEDWWSGHHAGAGSTAVALVSLNLSISRQATTRIRLYVSASTRSSLADSWAAMLRAIDRALTVRRLMKLCVRTGTRRLFGLIAYVFAILATCQHYGRRTEPDDRAPLFIRRQPMSMGSCTLAC